MCGICGVVQVGGLARRVVEPVVLDAMTDALRHRGPDDRGTFVADGVALGARRLSIVDVAGGHQPFASEDERVWAVQNGELYNHEALRAELRGSGHRFRSRCDTEVLPHLYERDGASVPERLRGKFAIAIWDERERRALLARDRLGVKPLYWARADDLVVFASELKSILASGLVEPLLDYEAIDAYLTFGFTPAPATPLVGIRKLLPGHRLVIDPDGVREEPYWHYPQPQPDVPPRPEADYADELLWRLREAVKLRLMSDVPLGAMLSGGLDSSLIVALMAEQLPDPVKTFSVGFREDASHSELADARTIANLFATDHHELELSYTDDTVDLPELVWHLDEPLADLSALGFLALSELARQHVTVALSGQGADELLGGYRKHRVASTLRVLDKVPYPLRRAGARVGHNLGGSARRLTRTIAAQGHAERLVAMSGWLPSDTRANLIRGPLADLDGSASRRAVERIADDTPDSDPLATTLYVDAQLALPDDMLHYFDRASMAHSLEVRVPFLDHELVEFCARVPTNLKVHHLTTKHLLKRAATGILPHHITHKRKIGFFNRSVEQWLATRGRVALTEYLFAGRPAVADLVDMGEVRSLFETNPPRWRPLFRVLMLELWLREFLPRAVGEPAHVSSSHG
jgi:asparagine synthase (glutamine-hydrolysing)